MKKQFIDAIESQFLIEFEYDGGRRLVEPYCYGVSTKGNQVLRGYQIGGFSTSGKLGWKLFDISKVISINILDERFSLIRADYKRGDKGMVAIYAEI